MVSAHGPGAWDGPKSMSDIPDWTVEMRAVLDRVPGLVWLPPAHPDGPHAAIVGDDKVERETLRELVIALWARFGEGR